MSNIDIVALTRKVEQQTRHSTSRQSLERLKQAGILEANGDLSPKYYSKQAIRQQKQSHQAKT